MRRERGRIYSATDLQTAANPLRNPYADVVGYANDALQANTWRIVCSQFLEIGKEAGETKLGQLKPNAEEKETGWNCLTDIAKFLKPNGVKEYEAGYYVWSQLQFGHKNALRAYGVNSEADFTPGWYKIDSTGAIQWGVCMNETNLPYGTGILVYSTRNNAKFRSSGEVVQAVGKKLIYELTANTWASVGNCTPVEIALEDFKPNAAEKETGWNCLTDVAKFLKPNGVKEYEAGYYVWSQLQFGHKNALKAYGVNSEADFTPGWYMIDSTGAIQWGKCINSKKIPAGNGVLVYSTRSAATITIPSAL